MQIKIAGALLLSLALVTASPDVDAKIYRTVDANGTVAFTDVPPKDDQLPIEVDTRNAYTPVAPAAAPQAEAEPEIAEEDVEVSYTALRITAPSQDEPVRENAGNVTISVAATPALDASHGHTLQVIMDGVVMANDGGSSLSLTNVDRGAHNVIAQIVDADGQIKITSESVTFHMLRHSALMRKKSTAK